ncbi:putative uncharacterized transposon-derived protein F54H12.3 [Orchesella cincta]|uniref:Uncharacterized transposon-derived protein F54H12.3 n=1 Tax=Orchesella cincta TaxID=48709 RepID=A0A1D2MH21_ORCCI|nr:putative uncharacterized transposon-derived protein F54H12.3 [Orchesella cincta]
MSDEILTEYYNPSSAGGFGSAERVKSVVPNRKAYAVPIKSKHGHEVTEAFRKILEEAGVKPKYLQCDLGKEFFNSEFKTLLKVNNIALFYIHSDKKACIVERWNRTIMNRISKWFEYSKSKAYISNLQDFVLSYNNSYHRGIGCSPNEVDEYNEMDVWLQLNKSLYSKTITQANKFRIGEACRIRIPKSTFEKGYTASFSNSIYTIHDVLKTNPPTYKLNDSDGDVLEGIFYKEELSKVAETGH